MLETFGFNIVVYEGKNILNKYKRKEIVGLIIIFGVRSFWYCNCLTIGQLYSDSYSYINYNFGKFGGMRMPLYPAIIRICRMFFGERYYLFMVVALQILASAVAVVYLFKTFRMITDDGLLSGIVTIWYGCSSGIMSWDTIILTESFSISISVFFLWALAKYVKDRKLKDGYMAVLFSMIAALIKPTLAVYVGVCLALLILQFFLLKTYRKIVIKMLTALGIVIIFFLLYSFGNWNNYGTFSLTTLGPRHSLVTCLETGSYKNYPDKELVKKIDEICIECVAQGGYLSDYGTTTPIMKLFGSNEKQININVSSFASYCVKTEKKAYCEYMIRKILYYWKTPYGGYANMRTQGNGREVFYILQKRIFWPFDIEDGFIVMILAWIMAVYEWIRTKECPWWWLGCGGTILGIEISVYLNAYGEFPRLTIYVQPFIYLGILLVLNKTIRYIKDRKKNANNSNYRSRSGWFNSSI